MQSHSPQSAPTLVRRLCPVCNSNNASNIFIESTVDASQLDEFAFASRKLPEYMHYRLVACPTCDLLYANPAPSSEGLIKAYTEAAFDSSEEAHFAARSYARLLPSLRSRLPDGEGILDIGTGDGAFLEEAIVCGYRNVEGVEPSLAPIAKARDDIRPLIRPGTFEGLEFDRNHYSLITCFQTIEHLANPAAIIRKIYGLLKPGGAVYLVGHNRRSFSAKILGTRSPIFDLEHLQLFSPKSARELLVRAGFTDIITKPIWNRYPLHYWIKLLPIEREYKLRLLKRLRTMSVGRMLIPLPAGNMACLGFKNK